LQRPGLHKRLSGADNGVVGNCGAHIARVVPLLGVLIVALIVALIVILCRGTLEKQRKRVVAD
jgi:hypothetical protein